MQAVTEQPIKKLNFFRILQSLSWRHPLTKKPEDSGYEIAENADTIKEKPEVGPNKQIYYMRSFSG